MKKTLFTILLLMLAGTALAQTPTPTVAATGIATPSPTTSATPIPSPISTPVVVIKNVPVPYPPFDATQRTALVAQLQGHANHPVTITYDPTDSSALALASGLAQAFYNAGWSVTGPTAAGGIAAGIHITATADMDNGSRAVWEYLDGVQQQILFCDSHQPISVYPSDWTPMAGSANLVGIAIGVTPVTCSQRGPGQS